MLQVKITFRLKYSNPSWFLISFTRKETENQPRLKILTCNTTLEHEYYFQSQWIAAIRYKKLLLYSLTITQQNRDNHWLILGHVALTKFKCILIRIQSTLLGIQKLESDQSGVTEGRESTTSFCSCKLTQILTHGNLQWAHFYTVRNDSGAWVGAYEL